MTTTLYRDLGTADVEVRSEGDGRTISGILVPWSRPTRIDENLTEEFLPGSFDRQVRSPGRIPLAREHLPHGGSLIGRVTMLRNDAKGLYGEARVSPTSLGEETLTLLRDGALDHLSIGFREGQNVLAGAVIQRKTAHMTELAVVMQGAYGDHAKVGAIRSADGSVCPECGEHPASATRSRLEQARQVLAGLPLLPPS